MDGLTADGGYAGLIQEDQIENQDQLLEGKDESDWALIAKDRASLAPLEQSGRWTVPALTARPHARPPLRLDRRLLQHLHRRLAVVIGDILLFPTKSKSEKTRESFFVQSSPDTALHEKGTSEFPRFSIL